MEVECPSAVLVVLCEEVVVSVVLVDLEDVPGRE